MNDITNGTEPVPIPLIFHGHGAQDNEDIQASTHHLEDLRKSFLYRPSVGLPDGFSLISDDDEESGCTCENECTSDHCECIEEYGEPCAGSEVYGVIHNAEIGIITQAVSTRKEVS